MSSSVFDTIYQIIYQGIKNKGFEVEKSPEQALFYNEKFVYRMKIIHNERKICLEYCNNEEECTDEWNSIASWLFDDNDMSPKYANMISNDFLESMLGPKHSVDKRSKGKKTYTDKGQDGLFFANRFVNIFPTLKDEIFIEKECYNEFRGSVFVKNSILPKVQELLSDGKDKNKIEKLVKLLGDLYKSSSLNIRSLITMGILNNIIDNENVDLIKNYMNDILKDAWEVSIKFKYKKVKPEKPKSSKSLMSRALSKQ